MTYSIRVVVDDSWKFFLDDRLVVLVDTRISQTNLHQQA
jgi:hypothetical protein